MHYSSSFLYPLGEKQMKMWMWKHFQLENSADQQDILWCAHPYSVERKLKNYILCNIL